MPRTIKVVDVKYEENQLKSNENNEEQTRINEPANDNEIEEYEAIKEENKQIDLKTDSNEITTTNDKYEDEDETTNRKQRIHNLVECPDCKKMILEKTLKYSHKQKCSARKVSPEVWEGTALPTKTTSGSFCSPPPPSPIITTKQAKPKKNAIAEDRGSTSPERILIPPKCVTFTPKSNNNVSNNSVSNNSVSQPLSRSQRRINKMGALFKDAIGNA